MTDDLGRFLSRHKRVSQDTAKWRDGIELEISGYICSETPPADLVSSVRAIVFKADDVLVMRNLDGTYILPGGRVEEGETFDETLRRELLEEAGVEIKVLPQIGLVHLRHTTPKPKGYSYPYPDFLWPVFVASVVGLKPDARVDDGYDIASQFLPLQEVRASDLENFESAFLEAAVSALRRQSTERSVQVDRAVDMERVIGNDEFTGRLVDLCLKSGLKGIPRRERDQHILLKSVALTLNPTREYTEGEMDDKLAFWLSDIARSIDLDRVTLRRWLVNEEYLIRQRDGTSYRVSIPAEGRVCFEASVEDIDVYEAIGLGMKSIAQKKREYLQQEQSVGTENG